MTSPPAARSASSAPPPVEHSRHRSRRRSSCQRCANSAAEAAADRTRPARSRRSASRRRRRRPPGRARGSPAARCRAAGRAAACRTAAGIPGPAAGRAAAGLPWPTGVLRTAAAGDPAAGLPGARLPAAGLPAAGLPAAAAGLPAGTVQAAPEADPFAEFLRGDEEPRPARSSVNHGAGPEVPVGPRYVQPVDAALRTHPAIAVSPEYSRSAQRRLDRSQVIYTPTVWALAMLPLIQMVVILLSVSSGAQSVPIAVPIAIQAVPYLAAIVLANFDRRALIAAGHRAPAHWALAFLTAPIYLVARSVATNREFGKGITPILVWASPSASFSSSPCLRCPASRSPRCPRCSRRGRAVDHPGRRDRRHGPRRDLPEPRRADRRAVHLHRQDRPATPSRST